MSAIFFAISTLTAGLPEAASEEELLHARRIIEFWRDQDSAFIRSEIETFFHDHPRSAFHDYFYAILGDLSLAEEHFASALNSYSLIQSAEIQQKVRLKRWNALYQLQQYQSIYQEIAPQKAYINDPEALFYFAEAALREALAIDKTSDESNEHCACLFDEALVIYESLLSEERFSSHARLAIAEIARNTGEIEKAATIYLKIAEEQKNPATLFHAAQLLLQCGHEEKATEIFGYLAKSGSSKASESAYQWMQLLAKHKEWDVLLNQRRILLTTLHISHLPVFHFYLGMLAYNEERYHDALLPLKESLQAGLKPPYDKAALLALLAASKELGETSICDTTFSQIQELYPQELEEAALMRAICYRKANKNEIALGLFSEIIQKAADRHLVEKTYFESMQLLTNMKRWEDAHKTVMTFLELFPTSTHKNEVIHLAVDLSLARLSQDNCYEDLMTDLNRALAVPNLYSPSIQQEKKLLLAKCYFKLNLIEQCLSCTSEMLNENDLSADLHYLMTACYAKDKTNAHKVIEHGEQILTLDPNFKDLDRIHLHLFNAYLEKSQTDTSEDLVYKAAGHLYEVLDVLPISLENRLWLANTYAKEPFNRTRAIVILEDIFTPQSELLVQYPKEGLLLAELYQHEMQHERALQLLNTLRKTEHNSKIELNVAISQSALGHFAKARAIFDHLTSDADAFIATSAKLHQSRLMLQGSEKAKGLHQLRELWVRKQLQFEPLHLEAAIDYVQALSYNETPSKQLELLNEIKENFTTQFDICSKDYHEARSLDKDKNQLYQAYIRLIDAKIYTIQANLPHLKTDEMKMKKKAARALFITLLQGKYAVTPYLIHQAEIEVNRCGT